MIANKGIFELYMFDSNDDANNLISNPPQSSVNIPEEYAGCFGKIQLPSVTRSTYKRKNVRLSREIELPDTLSYSPLVIESPVSSSSAAAESGSSKLIQWFLKSNRESNRDTEFTLFNKDRFSFIPPFFADEGYKILVLLVFAPDKINVVRAFKFFGALPVDIKFGELEGGSTDPLVDSITISVQGVELGGF